VNQFPPPIDAFLSIAQSLWPDTQGIAVVDYSGQVLGVSEGLEPELLAHQAKDSMGAEARSTVLVTLRGEKRLYLLPIGGLAEGVLGLICISASILAHAMRPADEIQKLMTPLIACVRESLQFRAPRRDVEAVSERSKELEWLFKMAGQIKAGDAGQNALKALIAAGAEHLGTAFVGLEIPSRRMGEQHCAKPESAEFLQKVWQRAKGPIGSSLLRRKQPVTLNNSQHAQCKVLAVPVEREDGSIIGSLAFLRLLEETDFNDKDRFVARHLGRQAAQFIDSQFDLMTGLYTQAGLEQRSAETLTEDGTETSIWYLDIDHLHVANQLHGFEVGDEVIVRIADLLSPPLLPANALAARLGTDRFAVVLPKCTANEARDLALAFSQAASALQLGPSDAPVEVSVSVGVATLLNMSQGFARALAAGELACKSAKSHGRGKVEIYNIENDSMMRRHGDVVAIGQLRTALKLDKLILFAQPIVSLRGAPATKSFEILLRMEDESGDLHSLGPLINAAHRYQLLPSIDKWVAQRALEMLAPYRSLLDNHGLGMSINISGQSISDETFVAQLSQWIKAARLPEHCIGIEITEQAAVTNLQRAGKLVERLRALGCQFALDDFGTGANSLTTFNALRVSRVKIDGSFVRKVLTDRSCRSTVRAIVELAAGQSIDTVAEFVETEEIADAVRELGVDYAQGYAFGKPRPLKDVLTELSAEESQRLHRLYLEN
jgi:diguanylate cyclase (GGDEF)-like protein